MDVDGNSLIFDFACIARDVRRQQRGPWSVSRVTEQVAQFTHTCFMVAPYEGYVEVCEQLNRLTPGDHEKRSALFNSGAEAVEQRRQDRQATATSAGPQSSSSTTPTTAGRT